VSIHSVNRALLLLAIAGALLAAVPAAEASPRRVPHGFYGVMWDRGAVTASDSQQVAQWNLMALSGVETVRTEFSWARAQPVGGEPPSFAATDKVVALAAARHISLLPIVVRTPSWAARDPSRGQASAPARVEDYVAYLQALVRRYGPQGSFWSERPDLPRRPLREWQIWNEPHLDYYWHTDGAWERGYANLLIASNAALKRSDRGSVTVLAGLADFVWTHLDRLYRAGIRGHYDVAAVNFFTRRPALVLRGLRYVRRALRRGGEPHKRMWLTETTWPASKGRVDKPRASWQLQWETTDRGMARRLTNFYALAAHFRRRLRLDRVYWYTWASAYHDGDLFDYSGLVQFADDAFTRRRALTAYARSALRAEGCRKTAAGTCR
jgi:hypothetical protein